MKVDYAVISSDNNPLYKDFYPIVAKRWFDLGIKTYYVNITDNDSLEQTEFGIIHNIKKIKNIPSSFQSQVVRIFVANFIDANLLMSDIDMLPINGDYYNQYNNEFNGENIILFSGQPYNDTPYFPMCYVLASSKILKSVLGFSKVSFEKYCKKLAEYYTIKWNADEHFVYDMFKQHPNILKIKNRDFSRRIDRVYWHYDINKLKQGYYIDSHMLRPYSLHREQIDKLVNDIKLNYA
jgi:hypothetical protein